MRTASVLRRLFQFRLRTLMLAVLVFCLVLGSYVRRVELQRQAVAAIRKAGGSVDYDYQFVNDEQDVFDFKADENAASSVPEILRQRLGVDYLHGIECVELLPGNAFDKALLAQLADLPQLKLLCVEGVNDDDLEIIGRLTWLRGLVITKASGVTDDGIVRLAKMKRLEMIALHGPRVTDKSLEILSSLPKLTTLAIASDSSMTPQIGPDGLRYIARLSQLRNLRLETQPGFILDERLIALRDLTRLERLMLGGFDINQEGLDNLARLNKLKDCYLRDSFLPGTAGLKQALPGCTIEP